VKAECASFRLRPQPDLDEAANGTSFLNLPLAPFEFARNGLPDELSHLVLAHECLDAPQRLF
jgi:hypothetical protein